MTARKFPTFSKAEEDALQEALSQDTDFIVLEQITLTAEQVIVNRNRIVRGRVPKYKTSRVINRGEK